MQLSFVPVLAASLILTATTMVMAESQLLPDRDTCWEALDYSLGGFCKPSPGGLRCEPEWHAGSWRIEPGANGSLIVRNDDITVNPSSSAAEERSEDAVTLKAANDEAAWRLQRMAGPCNYDASPSSSAAPPLR
jgi:hypothetical protein